jgi:hypothetical protein
MKCRYFLFNILLFSAFTDVDAVEYIPHLYDAYITLIGEPKVNEEVTLKCKVIGLADIVNTSVRICIPESIDVVSGQTEWQGLIGQEIL